MLRLASLQHQPASLVRSINARWGRQRARSITMATAAAGHTVAVVWFRNDLRTSDHEPLHAAASSRPTALLPVYCLDPRDLQPRRLLPGGSQAGTAEGAAAGSANNRESNSSGGGDDGPSRGSSGSAGAALGVPKLGPFRLRALLEALSGLDRELQGCGSRLAFHQGRPEEVLGSMVGALLAKGSGNRGKGGCSTASMANDDNNSSGGPGVRYGALELYYHLEPSIEAALVEVAVEAAVQEAAAKYGVLVSIHRSFGATLYHPDDLPYHLFASGQQAGSSKRGTAPAEGQASGDYCASAAGAAGGCSGGGGGSAAATRAAIDPARFERLPRVMTDFRKAVQAHARARPPLPKPTVLPPLPMLAGPQEALLGGPLPTELAAVYEAAGAGQALQQLEALVGLKTGSIPPPGSGPVDPRSAFPLSVDERAGLQRLQHCLHPSRMSSYQDSRMLAYGVGTSTKLSPFLALGCLSPRTVYWEALEALKQEEQGAVATVADSAAAGGAVEGATAAEGSEAGKDASTASMAVVAQQRQGEDQEEPEVAGQPQQAQQEAQRWQPPEWREPVRGDGVRWLLMHVGIRDFFLYTALKEGGALLHPGGILGGDTTWRADATAFERWAAGQTGLPFVDACIRELGATGWMSNRGRQNVASLLAKGLRLDWRLGAALFECLLVDCDWALNWGNWAYVSGTGNDPRNRQFKTVSQGEVYDPEATLIQAWVPELAHLPAALAHRPWEVAEGSAEAGEQGAGSPEGAGCARGAGSYPTPMVDPQTQIRRVRRLAGKKTG